MKYDIRSVLLLFMISLLAGTSFLYLAPGRFLEDSSSDFYNRDLRIAQQLVQYGTPQFNGNVVAIGMPLLVALELKVSDFLHIPAERVFRGVALLCLALSTTSIFGLARTLWNRYLAWGAALVWTTYPFALWLSGQNLTELPFMTVFFWGICIFGWSIKHRNIEGLGFFISGILLGVAILIRPIAIGVPIVLGASVLALIDSARIRQAGLIGIFLIGNLLVVAPWELFVFAQTGSVVLISTGEIPSIRDGLTFGVNSKGYREGFEIPKHVRELMVHAKEQETGLDTHANVATFIWTEFQNNPSGVLQFFVLKATRSWYGSDSMRYEEVILAIQLFYLTLAGLGLFQLLRQGENLTRWVWTLVILCLYFWFATITVLPILRYMLPAMGLLMVFIPGAIVLLGQGKLFLPRMKLQ